MAGITGIISLSALQIPIDRSILEGMSAGLKAESAQKHKSFQDENIFISIVSQTRTNPDANFYHNQEHGLICALDGFCFLDEGRTKDLEDKYDIPHDASTLAKISYLYLSLGEELFLQLQGSFNLFIYDIKAQKCLLANDRFGFYPLYYAQTADHLIFSSKLNSIIDSGLLASPKADLASMVEHLLFAYVISENSYIQGVSSLENASIIKIKNKELTRYKYWDIASEFDHLTLNKKQSIEAIDSGLKAAVSRISSVDDSLLCSITGGWDSRVVLSYLLPHAKEKIHCYSFGAQDAPDITIPQLISRQESFRYHAFGLDQKYLDNDFIKAAKETIKLSSGTRNYKRSHYLYALKQMGEHSQHLMSGIFGDQVFKVGRPKGNVVLSQIILNALETNFELDSLHKNIQSFLKIFFPDHLGKELEEELLKRMAMLQKQYSVYSSASQRYIAFRFQINLRKYFGNEASSYNDFSLCYSPFTDFNFVSTWLRSFYAGQLYPYEAPSKAMQRNSTTLYATLVKRNYKPLIFYPTARGYTMADALSLSGNLRILKARLQRRKNMHKDAFSTQTTDSIFREMIKQENIKIAFDISKFEDSKVYEDALSLFYWQSVLSGEL